MVYGDFYSLASIDPFLYANYHSQTSYLQGDYKTGSLKTRLYWMHSLEAQSGAAVTYVPARVNIVDSDTSYSFNLGDKHSFLVGGGGKLSTVRALGLFSTTEFLTKKETTWDVYLQDEYAILKKLNLVGSARVDHYPLKNAKYNPSWRVAAVYTPDQENIFRASVGHSFRAPDFAATYLYYQAGVPPVFDFIATGNRDLKAEQYLTYEAGYQGYYLERKLRPFMDLFLTEIKGPIASYPTGGHQFLNLDQAYINKGKIVSEGGELGAEYDVIKGWTLIGNYALNHVRYSGDPQELFNPEHKFNFGFKFKGMDNKLSVHLLAHYVRAANSRYGNASMLNTKSYVMGMLGIGYQVNDAVELVLSGYNIFGDKHVEMPNGDTIGSRVLGTLMVKF